MIPAGARRPRPGDWNRRRRQRRIAREVLDGCAGTAIFAAIVLCLIATWSVMAP